MTAADKLREEAQRMRNHARTQPYEIVRMALNRHADGIFLLADACEFAETVEATADRPFLPPEARSLMKRIEEYAGD